MGFSLTGGSSPNAGLIFAPLNPIDSRVKLGKGHSAKEIVADVAPKLFAVQVGSLRPLSRQPSRVSARWVASSLSCWTRAEIALAILPVWSRRWSVRRVLRARS